MMSIEESSTFDFGHSRVYPRQLQIETKSKGGGDR